MAQMTTTERATATLRITEIYRSIQGESTWAGLPCTFVRLARCHIRCVWCDTAYAFKGGTNTSVESIVDRCRELAVPLVELTGGEPLVQKDCPALAQALLDAGFTVLVETSGTLPIAVLPAACIKIMDLKCPDSGVCDQNDWSNIDALTHRDEVKFVLASRRDYEWARDVVRKHRLTDKVNAVLFSVAFDCIDPKDVVSWILEDALNVRFQLQMHKVIWDPNEKSV